MKIGLIDADLLDNGTRHPNLAIMKLAGYYLENGNTVELIEDYMQVYDYEKVFISKVFTFTNVPDWVLELDFVSIGGTGFFLDGGANLPDEIEHHMPYYDIYKNYIEKEIALGKKRTHFQDYLDYSIGFTTRGCFRKCEFCVNKKYDHVFRHSPVEEFLDKNRPYIYLWDDNILAYPHWEEVLDDIEATGKQFQFRQGIDIRLMTDKKAKRFVNAKYQGDFIFAFDHSEDKELIVDKLQLWKRYSSKTCKLYVISAFKSQDEKDVDDVFQRIHTLMKLGSIPYIMRYEAYKQSLYRSMYIELARWCNQPNFFKKMSFREFCVANQKYKKDQSTNCSAYQAMLDFENEHPEIANKYFDLKFEEENMYAKQYGYGRKYANKPLCKTCKKRGICWSTYIDGTCSEKEILKAYFTKEIDFECLRYATAECDVNVETVVKKLINQILSTSEEDIIKIIKESDELEEVTKDNIPQYSNLKHTYIDTPQIINDSGEEITFEMLGYYLKRNNDEFLHNSVADKKYGENHAKLAALLDLVRIDKAQTSHKVEMSEFGKVYCTLSLDEKEQLVRKLRYRIPIVQKYYLGGEDENVLEEELSILSLTTKNRRRSNVINVVQWISE